MIRRDDEWEKKPPEERPEFAFTLDFTTTMFEPDLFNDEQLGRWIRLRAERVMKQTMEERKS